MCAEAEAEAEAAGASASASVSASSQGAGARRMRAVLHVLTRTRRAHAQCVRASSGEMRRETRREIKQVRYGAAAGGAGRDTRARTAQMRASARVRLRLRPRLEARWQQGRCKVAGGRRRSSQSSRDAPLDSSIPMLLCCAPSIPHAHRCCSRRMLFVFVPIFGWISCFIMFTSRVSCTHKEHLLINHHTSISQSNSNLLYM